MNNITNPDFLDRFAMLDCPVVLMPHSGQLEPLSKSGRRLIVASDGLYKEVRRPWLRALVQIGKCRTPYGKVQSQVQLATALPQDLMREFQDYATKATPNEVAAWIVWDERTGTTELLKLKEQSVSKVHITFERPCLPSHQHILGDVHSHHVMSPKFSAMDDADDRANGGTYVAAVIGHILENPTWNFRLVLDGEPFDLLKQNLQIGPIHD